MFNNPLKYTDPSGYTAFGAGGWVYIDGKGHYVPGTSNGGKDDSGSSNDWDFNGGFDVLSVGGGGSSGLGGLGNNGGGLGPGVGPGGGGGGGGSSNSTPPPPQIEQPNNASSNSLLDSWILYGQQINMVFGNDNASPLDNIMAAVYHLQTAFAVPLVLMRTLSLNKTNKGRNVNARPGITLDSKIISQMARRGWTQQSINNTVNNPYTIRAAINRATGNPATAFYTREGAYVVRDNVTGQIIQISNRFDLKWVPDGTIVNPFIP